MTHSPVFVATFNDGTQTRLTVWHDPEHKTLNLDRGIRLAQHAYRSRKGQEPPLVVAGRFERDGEILASYTASEVADNTAAEPTEEVATEPAEETQRRICRYSATTHHDLHYRPLSAAPHWINPDRA